MDPVTLAVISGAKLAMDGIKYFNAQSKEREAARAAEKAFNTMMSTKETDYYAGLQTPTLGYDLATQAALQSQAAGIQALQGAGAAGVIGGVTALAGQEADRRLQLAAQLQSDQAAVERMKAQGQQGIAAREFNKQLDLQQSQLEGARLEQLIQQRRRREAAAGMTETITGGLGEYLGDKPLYGEITDRQRAYNNLVADKGRSPMARAEMDQGKNVRDWESILNTYFPFI